MLGHAEQKTEIEETRAADLRSTTGRSEPVADEENTREPGRPGGRTPSEKGKNSH
jgi:hypothetical protein